jgi:hypothetical protein
MVRDPIISAIATHRSAHRAYKGSLAVLADNPQQPDRHQTEQALRQVAAVAAWTLLDTIPTTPAGAIMLSLYAGHFIAAGNDWPTGWERSMWDLISKVSGRGRR